MDARKLILLLCLIAAPSAWECGGGDAPISEGPANRRQLLSRSSTLGPLRLSYQYSNFDLGSSSANTYFKDTIISAVDSFVRRAIKVKQVQGNLIMPYSTCGTEVVVPSAHQTTGVPDTDLIVYITSQNDSTVTYLAYAGPCALDSGLNNVIAGRIMVNLATLKVGDFQANYPVILHELWHILGFVSGIMSYWKKENGSSYATSELFELTTIRGAPKSILKTPNVLQKAREAFGCLTLAGVETDGAGSNSGSHWSARIMFNDFMIPYDNGIQIYSTISLALLKDTGWYDVDYSVSEVPIFGRNYGCNFFDTKCLTNGVSNFPNLYCDKSASWQCDVFNLNKGLCGIYTYSSIPSYYSYFSDPLKGGGDPSSDYCPYRSRYSNGNCRGGSIATFVLAAADEVIGPKSRCFNSNLLRSGSMPMPYAACYEVLSCTTTSANIKVGTQTVSCPFTGGPVTVTGYSGSLICPNSDVVCNDVPCLEGCRGVGQCVKGTCQCMAGYSGTSCEVKNLCDTSCSVCSNGLCITCNLANTVPSGNKCVCASGFYDSGNLNCVRCVSPCVTCQSGSSCNSCVSGFYLVGTLCTVCPGVCLTCDASGCLTCKNNASKIGSSCSCNDGFFELNGICQACDTTCTKCSSLTSCSACLTGYYLSGSSCLKCNELCIDCNINTCLSCKPNASIVSFKCICNAGYYNLNGICTLCTSPCVTCTSKSLCTSCQSGFYLSSSSCLSCPVLCPTCDINGCLTCKSNSEILGNNCVCKLGFYQNLNNCESCPQNCKSCGSGGSCTDCLPGFSLYLQSCVPCSGLCVTCSQTECLTCKENSEVISGGCLCKSGFYNSGDICVNCLSPCVECSSGSICLKCLDGFYLYQNVCAQCSALCLTCNSDTCLTCKPLSSVVSGTCKCNEKYFENNGGCSPCQSPCDTCSGNNICESCLVGFYLSGSSCLNCEGLCTACTIDSCSACINFAEVVNSNCQCIKGYYLENSECLPCPSNCKQCTNLNHCTECKDGLSLSEGKCIVCPALCTSCSLTSCLTCKDRAFVDGYICRCLPEYYEFQGECLSCIQPCATCLSESLCSSCMTGYYLSGSVCLKCEGVCETCNTFTCLTCKLNAHLIGSTCVCDTGKFNDNGICNNCQSPCKECTSLLNCLLCDEGYFISNGKCEKCFNLCTSCDASKCISCVENAVKSGNTCQCLQEYYHTSTGCSKCIGGCSSCPSGICQACKSGFYLNSNNVCIGCSSLCLTCNVNGCIDCVENAVRQLDICICPSKFYLFGNSCLPCVFPCDTCEDSNKCLTCVNGYYLSSSSCFKCPALCTSCNSLTCIDCVQNAEIIGNTCKAKSGFYEENGQVFPCIENCLACSSSSLCITCKDGFVYTNNYCSTCPSLCLTCSISSCLTCANNANLVNQDCICKDGFYFNQLQCIQCGTDCLKCSGPSICDQCPARFYQSNQNCIKCSDFCLECDVSGCSLCEVGKKVVEGLCVDDLGPEIPTCSFGCKICKSSEICLTCNEGFKLMSDNTCSACPLLCESCTLQGCETCVDYAAVSGTMCVCRVGYYLSTDNCKPCSTGCAICSETACIYCNPGYYLLDGICVECPPLCVTCTALRCGLCTTNAFLSVNTCICRAGFYGLYKGCAVCTLGCATCLTASNCLTCIRGYYLKDTSCLACAELCVSCNATSCISCKANALIVNGNCVCRPGYFNNFGICTLCSLGCSSCSTLSSCSACYVGYYLSESACFKCPELCASCSVEKCLTCKAYGIVSGNNCICRNGAYYSNGACYPCPLGCALCTGSGECSSCSGGYYLTGTTCKICPDGCSLCGGEGLCTRCKTGFYLSSGNCIACSVPFCAICSSTVCTRCITNYVLVGGLCVFLS